MSHAAKSTLILMGAPLPWGSMQEEWDHTAQGVWLTVHPITLGVANIKARCLHVSWQDVPPLVLKPKGWLSPSRAGFAL